MKILSTETEKVVTTVISHEIHGIIVLKDHYAADTEKVIDSRLYKDGEEIDDAAILEEVMAFVDGTQHL